MTAIATVADDDLVGRTRLWPSRPGVTMPRWRHGLASCLILACATVPDASLHAKWTKLSLVTRLAFHRYIAPST